MCELIRLRIAHAALRILVPAFWGSTATCMAFFELHHGSGQVQQPSTHG